MKNLVIAALMALLVGSMFALSAGDIAIVGVLADNPDVVGFIALIDLPGGTVITFTDRAWRNSTQEFSSNTLIEGFLRWTAPAGGLTAGTVVTLTSNGVNSGDPFVPSVGSIAESDNFQLSYDSDQVLAFEGTTNPASSTSALWLWGLSLSNWTWTNNSPYTSDLPTALQGYEVHFSETGGQYAGVDNAFYANTQPFTGTRAQMIALLSSPANYVATDDYTNQLPSYSITVDETLPVVLSSFSATITSQYFVQLHWVTQSETDALGYMIYRSLDNDLQHAIQVSPLINATNTATQVSYEYTDAEVTPGTWYYWLQSLDLNGNFNFHGPILATVSTEQGGEAPPIPTATGISKVYPNPFNPSLTIRYELKEALPVSFKIYNARGQMVQSFELGNREAGVHNLSWDANGQATGIYLIRMQAGNKLYNSKAVLSK